MIIKEIKVKGIVTKSNLPDANYVINPYIGCMHGCIYCYAVFMKRFTNHKEPWGEFVDVKINANEVLENLNKYKGKHILISSVTDPYQPIEAKYKLTRKILKCLIPADPKIEILTKGRMVVRDIDLLKQYENATVGVSIATIDDKLSKELEPLAPSPRLRIDAIKKCKEAGLRTYVFFSPIFPHITEIEEIINLTKEYTDYYMFENLNLRKNNSTKILEFIKNNRPHLLTQYNEIYFQKQNIYWDLLSQQIKELSYEYGKEARIYFHHGGFKKV